VTTTPTYQPLLQFQHRARKRAEVEQFFMAHLGQKFSSYSLHVKYGPGLRSRISEINLDPAAEITINNQTFFDEEADQEVSGYWAELRIPRHRDDG
jgi:hypothetical protein